MRREDQLCLEKGGRDDDKEPLSSEDKKELFSTEERRDNRKGLERGNKRRAHAILLLLYEMRLTSMVLFLTLNFLIGCLS